VWIIRISTERLGGSRGSCTAIGGAAQYAEPQTCVTAPKSPLVVNVKGAKGDGQITRRKRSFRIQSSKFLNNAGPGIAGKKGAVARVELARNVFKGNLHILVENAPAVLASVICDNRQVASETARAEGPYAFADPVDVVAHQNDCQDGSDMGFEVNRQSRKRNK